MQKQLRPVSLERTLLPDLAAMPWEGDGVVVDPRGYYLMADMGNGTRSIELLGAGKSAPDTGSLLAGSVAQSRQSPQLWGTSTSAPPPRQLS